jgi:uncharacterized protein (TIGR00251 family)
MILKLRVIPRSSRNSVIKQEDNFKVYLTRPAQDGQANEQLIDLLADYLKIKKYQIKIIKGLKSRDKLVEVNE